MANNKKDKGNASRAPQNALTAALIRDARRVSGPSASNQAQGEGQQGHGYPARLGSRPPVAPRAMLEYQGHRGQGSFGFGGRGSRQFSGGYHAGQGYNAGQDHQGGHGYQGDRGGGHQGYQVFQGGQGGPGYQGRGGYRGSTSRNQGISRGVGFAGQGRGGARDRRDRRHDPYKRPIGETKRPKKAKKMTSSRGSLVFDGKGIDNQERMTYVKHEDSETSLGPLPVEKRELTSTDGGASRSNNIAEAATTSGLDPVVDGYVANERDKNGAQKVRSVDDIQAALQEAVSMSTHPALEEFRKNHGQVWFQLKFRLQQRSGYSTMSERANMTLEEWEKNNIEMGPDFEKDKLCVVCDTVSHTAIKCLAYNATTGFLPNKVWGAGANSTTCGGCNLDGHHFDDCPGIAKLFIVSADHSLAELYRCLVMNRSRRPPIRTSYYWPLIAVLVASKVLEDHEENGRNAEGWMGIKLEDIQIPGPLTCKKVMDIEKAGNNNHPYIATYRYETDRPSQLPYNTMTESIWRVWENIKHEDMQQCRHIRKDWPSMWSIPHAGQLDKFAVGYINSDDLREHCQALIRNRELLDIKPIEFSEVIGIQDLNSDEDVEEDAIDEDDDNQATDGN